MTQKTGAVKSSGWSPSKAPLISFFLFCFGFAIHSPFLMGRESSDGAIPAGG